jgi:hypothetical protein
MKMTISCLHLKLFLRSCCNGGNKRFACDKRTPESPNRPGSVAKVATSSGWRVVFVASLGSSGWLRQLPASTKVTQSSPAAFLAASSHTVLRSCDTAWDPVMNAGITHMGGDSQVHITTQSVRQDELYRVSPNVS